MRMQLVALALAGFGAVGASAQMMSNPGQWYINNQLYSTRVFNSAVGTSMVTGGKGAAASAPAARDITRFSSSASTLPAALAAKEAGTADARKAAQARYAGFVDLYRRTAQKDGFPSDDLAYAHEYFVVNNYQLLHDLVDLPADQDPWLRGARDGFERIEAANRKRLKQVTMLQERAVYRQFREHLAASPQVAAMTDAQKQEAAETLAIAYGVNAEAYTAGIARRDEALMKQAREQARIGLEKLIGRPAARIRIDERGVAE